MKSRLVAVTLALFLIPSAAADLIEDYEDDTVNVKTSEWWYTSAGFDGAKAQTCDAGFTAGSGLCLEMLGSSCCLQTVDKTIPTSAYDWMSLDMYRAASGGSRTTSNGGANYDQQYLTLANGNDAIFKTKISTNGQVANEFGVVGSIAGNPAEISIYWEFYWGNQTYSMWINDVLFDSYVAFANSYSNVNKLYFLNQCGGSAYPGCESTKYHYDNIILGSTTELETASPTAPASLTGFVRNIAEGGADEAEIVLRWELSDNDPDQDVGDYEYYVIPNGFTSIEQLDPTTASDANGIRETVYSTTSVGNIVFTVRAKNVTTGAFSDQSCAILLDTTELFDVSQCGPNPPPANGIGASGFLPGVDIGTLASDLGMDASAFNWLLALAITAGIAGAGVASLGVLGGLGGAVLGIGLSTAFGLMPPWVLLILVLVAAVIVFVRRG